MVTATESAPTSLCSGGGKWFIHTECYDKLNKASFQKKFSPCPACFYPDDETNMFFQRQNEKVAENNLNSLISPMSSPCVSSLPPS